MPRTTNKADLIVDFVNTFVQENGYAPSVREIGAAVSLAVLPSRLKGELTALAEAIVAGKEITADEVLCKHTEWVAQLKQRHVFTEENAMKILMEETGKVFAEVLEDAGVYKCTAEGREAFLRFVEHVNH